MKNNVLIVLMLFFLSSCRSQGEEYLQKLNRCIDKTINLKVKDIYGIESFDYYKLMGKVENIIFQDPTKESYQLLIQKIHNIPKNKVIEDGLDEMNKQGFFINDHIVDILNNCPYISLDKDDSKETSIKLRQKIIEQSYSGINKDGVDILVNYFNHTTDKEFKYLEFRSPILIMILTNYLKLNPR
ncbi:hypothetical protein GTQ40_01885 [Flavobacteriaceae bacterium R38]|nr:hypothetical protein [Flavobacteriaceae bacterium R38]